MSTLPDRLRHLPAPDPAERARSRLLQARLLDEIDRDGFVPFTRFMEIVLYQPGLGYYASGAAKFGAAGDFVTAPETTELFGRALAAQAAQALEAGCDDVLELGAGRGLLAADILRELERRGRLPRRYRVLEVSASLRERQRATLEQKAAHLLERVEWLDRLPDRMNAFVFGNEVLDALPVALVTFRDDGIYELGVARRGPGADALAWRERRASGELLQAAQALALPPDYTTEIHLAAQGLVRSLGDALERGLIVFVDYGFGQREYYHPQRSAGTLMCHYRHHAHDDPLQLIGLQDISAHVEFSALAAAACDSGLDVLGYATQAQFLINCGILDLLAATPVADTARYAAAAGAVQKLLSPAEMGELVKVIAFGRGVRAPLVGFASGNRRGTL